MRPELVIFDCDGVLVDSERLAVEVEARLLTELGWPITPEEVARRFVGTSDEAALAEVEAHIGPERAREFDERSTVEVLARFERELEVVEGVEEVLDRVEAAGIATCVASNGSHEKMRATLGLTGLWDRFAGRIFSARDVARGKPAPDLFLHAAATMGVPPERCLVVEDSPSGVAGAVAAGMVVLGYAGGLTAADVLEAAGAITFATMADAPIRTEAAPPS